MCKHLLRPPYIEGIIDDPKGSVAVSLFLVVTSLIPGANYFIKRIENNKKVNYGKKKAIEAGRKAMSHSIQAQRSTRNFVDDEDDLDADYDSDQAGHSQDHTGVMLNPNQSHEDFSRMNRTNSLEVQDQSYREGSVPKRAKKPSRSIYQMNEHGQMIDTSMPPSANSRSLQPSYGSSLILNSQFPHPLGTTQSMAHHPADSPWTSNANINTYSHGSINPAGNEQQQVSRQRPRRNTRR